MRALLIDPVAKSITEVDYTGDYTNIYTHIQADTFCTVRFSFDDAHDCIFLDDEGLLKPKPAPFFQIPQYPDPLCGRGLVVGIDAEGESITPAITKEFLQAIVTWPDVEFAGFIDREYTRNGVFVLERKSIFRPQSGVPT